jgi:hypothetical protein
VQAAARAARRPLRIAVSAQVCDPSRFNLEREIPATIEVAVENAGAEAAREVYLRWRLFHSPSGAEGALTIHPLNDARFRRQPENCFELADGARLNLGAQVPICRFQISVSEQIREGLELELVAGCQGSEPTVVTLRQSAESLRATFATVERYLGGQQLPQDFALQVARTVFGVE